MPQKPITREMSDEQIRADSTTKTATQIKCEYCDAYNPYGTTECSACKATLDYKNTKNIVYSEVFDTEKYNSLINARNARLRVNGRDKTDKAIRKGCLIAGILFMSPIIIVIITGVWLGISKSVDEYNLKPQVSWYSSEESSELEQTRIEKTYYQNADSSVKFDDVGTLYITSLEKTPEGADKSEAGATSESDEEIEVDYTLKFRFEKSEEKTDKPIPRIGFTIKYTEVRSYGSTKMNFTHEEYVYADTVNSNEEREVHVKLKINQRDNPIKDVRLDEALIRKDADTFW
ncbi:hypothetical protein AGMMS50284_2550 [Clostridia bacterium]|nr:hypothetical protein AGMMS50284_2500 [Clostridia bacterium]GHU81829.1 hypothetical protein AGMMS50284_2550 [Clostridia bacterium]